MLKTPNVKLYLFQGSSGSGKTSLVNYLQKSPNIFAQSQPQSQSQTSILNMDNFYKDVPKEIIESGQLATYNFDSADAFDWLEYERTIHDLREGKDVEILQYSFAEHRKIDKKIIIKSAPIILVEGIMVAHNISICDLAEKIIFIKTDLDECVLRRISRDTKSEANGGRGRTVESVIHQWRTQVKPSYKKYVKFSQEFKKIYKDKIIYINNTDNINDMYNSKGVIEIIKSMRLANVQT